jgi:hypothetical protein
VLRVKEEVLKKKKRRKKLNGKEGDGEIRGLRFFFGWDKSFSDRYA